MNLDFASIANVPRLLFEVPLRPLQGQRFQPTGFPGLGAATFQTASGQSLLVESAQSMANRLELTVWDAANNDLIVECKGLSHLRILRGIGSTESERRKSETTEFFTDTVLEAHRLNSPYVMFAKHQGRLFFDTLGEKMNAFEVGPVPRQSEIAKHFIYWDIGSLLHGAFLSTKNEERKTLAGGRLRVARALSAFIEADGVRVAASGGVKNDHVNPSGDTKAGFGNVPFVRDEFTADRITLYVNLDLGQIRGYGLGADAERLLILLALYKLRALLDGSLRLRTACDLEPASDRVEARRPTGFVLPDAAALANALRPAIDACAHLMTVTEVRYDDELKKSKDKSDAGSDGNGD